jgi:hypothetical protein
MSNDARPGHASRIGLLVDDLDAAGVVDMSVRVDDCMHRAIVPASDRGEGLRCPFGIRRIDQHQPGGLASAEVVEIRPALRCGVAA